MWSKFGLIDVTVNANGNCFFKLKCENGMNKVLEQGPWIVKNRPLFVQKWDPIIEMEMVEQTRTLLWEKLTNVPLEAWSGESISAFTSSLGKILIMDSITAQMR